MGFTSSVTILLVALLVLGFSSSRVVSLLTGISSKLKMPKFLLSFVVLGLGTSLPDLFVTSQAAAAGQADLVISTIIGANIIVICLVLGLVTIIKGDFRVKENAIIDNFGYLFFVLAIPFFLMLDGKLTSTEGLILLIVYFMYIFNVREQESVIKKEEEETHAVFMHGLKVKKVSSALLQMVLLMAIAYIASNYIVDSAINIIANYNIHPILMGFTILSLGIAIPEFGVDLSALRAREEEVIWGDLIGSFVTELTFVLGIAAIIAGNIVFTFSNFLVAYSFMVFAFVMVFFFAYRKKELSRMEGIVLVLIYFIFLSVQFDLVHSFTEVPALLP
ncbi:sodium:calcium antiporter [Candidatus Micrarchaeota archaeon]|nr:sodium:calcium antiporter [Candidatus Micrarchaeota archaeon]